MDNGLYFISMEGRSNFKIGDFQVREDIPLPVYVASGEKLSLEKITPENIIGGMIKILIEDMENDHIDYYREFIYKVQPDINARLTAGAYEAEKNKSFKDALDIFRVLYALKPDFPDNILNLAVCYDEYSQNLFENGKENEALKMEELSFDFFKELDESDLEKNDAFYYYFGRFYLYRENYEKAVEYFEDFTRVTNDQDRKKEVKELLSNIKNMGVTNDDYQMAQNLITSDKNQEALEFINKYIDKYPDSYQGYYLKGVCYKNLEDYNEAVSLFEKALKFNTNSSDLLNEIGICYMNLGIFYKAELYFTNALKKNPEDLAILYNFAILYYRKKDIKEAIKYCNIILEFNPNDLHARDLKKLLEEHEV